jgi:hypothetical protein
MLALERRWNILIDMDINLRKAKVNFLCPQCDFINTVTLGDAMDGNSIICVGCLATIQLNDGEGSTKRSVASVEDALGRLQDTIDGH